MKKLFSFIFAACMAVTAFAEVYTVAGSPAKLFGTEWDPSNTANVMTEQTDGTYKWEKTDVEMSATTVQFKVVKGSAWGTEYPSSNYNLKIAKSGKYTITITFNPNGNKVAATATLQEEVDVIPSIAIAGDMNGWNTTASTFTMAADKKTASLVLNLDAKDYGFKMIIGGSWTNDGQKITRENNSAVYTGANVDANGTLTADVAGEYTFTWTYATSTLEVTYPALAPDPEPGDTTVTPDPEPGEMVVDSAMFDFKTDAGLTALNIAHPSNDLGDGTFDTALDPAASYVSGDITMTVTHGTSSKTRILKSTTGVLDLQMSTKGSLTFKAPEGGTITKIVFVGRAFKTTVDGVTATKTWTGEKDSVTFVATSTNRIYSANVTYTKPATTPDPEPGDTTVTPDPEQPTVTYTVAGSSEAAFGTTWSCDNAANDMTLQADGTYKWEKTGLELLAGSLDFKVCKDHTWDVAYPGSDYKLTIPATGIYTVTITFNPTTEEVNATATKTGDVVIIPTIAMHGNFAGASSWNDTENFTIAADEKTATLVMNLEARSDYEFGMRIGGKGDWTANGAAFARESNSAVIEKGTGNITLIADVAGEYTFTWTYATNTLVITFPAKSTVGFENIEAAEKAVKFIENGQIFILRDGAVYNLMGARVK